MGHGTCKSCGNATWPPLFDSSRPAPDQCFDCKSIEGDDDEISTDDRARCPRCRHTQAYHDDNYEWCSDGEHAVTCGNCGYDYEISTSVSFSFESPAMLPEAERFKEEP